MKTLLGLKQLPRLAYFHKSIRKILQTAISAVDPSLLIRKNVIVVNKDLDFKVGSFDNPLYNVKHNIYICGFGKAVAPMAAQLQDIFKPHIEKGIISIPKGYSEFAKKQKHSTWLPSYPIEVVEGSENNIPDENSLEASGKIVKLLQSLSKDDILFVLISGGGSALCPLPKPPITLEEKRQIIQHLSKAGATIQELNKVRIRLSSLKGGQLLQHTKAQVIALILSDIVGDPLELIASGPTIESNVSADEALEVLDKYNFDVTQRLREAIETKTGTKQCASVANHLIGSNRIALEAAKGRAESLEFHTVIASDRLTGEAREIGRKLVKMVDGDYSGLDLSEETVKQLNNLPRNELVCLLFGGETTVKVVGKGKGGRNQEMALAAGIALENHEDHVVFLSAGTDGIDGPTDAAGAVVDETFVKSKREKGLNAEEFLENNDSHTYFTPPEQNPTSKEYYAILKPGHTGTNVMDIQILLFQHN